VSSLQICTTRFAVPVHEDGIELGAVSVAAADTGVIDSLGY